MLIICIFCLNIHSDSKMNLMGKVKYKKSITMCAYNSENDLTNKIIFNERARIYLRSLEWRSQRRKPECPNRMLLYIYFFGILCYCDKQPEQKLLSRRKELFPVLVLSMVLDSLPSALYTYPHPCTTARKTEHVAGE